MKDLERSMPLVWVMMGVAGSGKTTLGRLWAARLDCDFLEGDRCHSAANIQKMAAQTPLNEADRRQWLDAIATEIHHIITRQRETVITCSALKQAHRQRLVALGPVQLIWLHVPEADLHQRLSQRRNHYMPVQLLTSQLATFEAICTEAPILTVDATQPPSAVVDQIWQQAVARYPSLEQAWWQR